MKLTSVVGSAVFFSLVTCRWTSDLTARPFNFTELKLSANFSADLTADLSTQHTLSDGDQDHEVSDANEWCEAVGKGPDFMKAFRGTDRVVGGYFNPPKESAQGLDKDPNCILTRAQ
jgi:hypothetical protein